MVYRDPTQKGTVLRLLLGCPEEQVHNPQTCHGPSGTLGFLSVRAKWRQVDSPPRAVQFCLHPTWVARLFLENHQKWEAGGGSFWGFLFKSHPKQGGTHSQQQASPREKPRETRKGETPAPPKPPKQAEALQAQGSRHRQLFQAVAWHPSARGSVAPAARSK